MKGLKAIGRFFAGRLGVLVSLLFVTGAGFFLWNYEGPLGVWLKYYVTAAVYEVFWCLVFYLIWPKRKNALRIAVGVFLATCLLEVMQLWRAEFLQSIRATFLGAAIIGTSFVWWQFPHYVGGSIVGYFWMRILGRGHKETVRDEGL